MIEKTKQKYVKPHMEVYELKHQPQLLAGSEANAGVQNYDLENEQNW